MLEQGGECHGSLTGVTIDDVLPLLTDDKAIEAGRSLAGLLLPAGRDCGKASGDKLQGESTPARQLLARLLLAGPCDEFLEWLIYSGKPLLAQYRNAVEAELASPPGSFALAVGRMQAYGTVTRNAALFSKMLPAKILDAIRGARGTSLVPTDGQTQRLNTLVARGGPLAEAILDLLAAQAAGWKPPAGSLDKPDHRRYLNHLHDLAVHAERQGRAAAAAAIRGLVTPAFGAELEAIAKKTPEEMAAFVNAPDANPLAGEMIAKLRSPAGRWWSW